MTAIAKNSSAKQKFYWIFTLGLIFFASYYVDIWHTPNPVSRALPVLTKYELGTIEITKYEHVGLDKSKVEEKYFSDKAPLPSFLTIPVYEAVASFSMDQWNYQEAPFSGAPIWYKRISLIIFLGSLICGILPFVAMQIFTFKLAGQYPYKPILIILTFFGTYLFIYAGTYFNHILSGCFLAFASYFTLKEGKGDFLLTGLFCGLAFLSEYTMGLFAALIPLLLLLRKNKFQSILYFAIGFAPALLIYAWYNYTLTGNPFTFIFYYTDFETFSKGIKSNYGFGWPSFESIIGLLVSPYMGILWFFPPLFFYFQNWRKKPLSQLSKDPILINSLALFVLISCYFIWWGGYSWGPRYLVPMACILALYSTKVWEQVKKPIVPLVVLGVSFIVQFMSKSTILFLIPDRLSEEGEASFPLSNKIIPAMLDGNFNTNNLLSWTTGSSGLLSATLFLLLFFAWLVLVEKNYRKAFLKS